MFAGGFIALTLVTLIGIFNMNHKNLNNTSMQIGYLKMIKINDTYYELNNKILPEGEEVDVITVREFALKLVQYVITVREKYEEWPEKLIKKPDCTNMTVAIDIIPLGQLRFDRVAKDIPFKNSKNNPLCATAFDDDDRLKGLEPYFDEPAFYINPDNSQLESRVMLQINGLDYNKHEVYRFITNNT